MKKKNEGKFSNIWNSYKSILLNKITEIEFFYDANNNSLPCVWSWSETDCQTPANPGELQMNN